MRSNCVADHRQQAMNTSAVNGSTTSTTKPDGQSAIDSSNVAIKSAAIETAIDASTPARTEGRVAMFIVVCAGESAMQDCCSTVPHSIRFLRAINHGCPTIAPQGGPPPRPARTAAVRGCGMDFETLFAKTPATLD